MLEIKRNREKEREREREREREDEKICFLSSILILHDILLRP
jgi:hypothetical protein